MNILVFRYNISFIDPPLGGFGEIFLEVMIFPSGYHPLEISSLQEIFRRIPLAPGLSMIKMFPEQYKKDNHAPCAYFHLGRRSERLSRRLV